MSKIDSFGQGRVTLPAQAGMEKETIELAKKWGVDAVRDSDGTVLSSEITELGLDVYSTLCLVRADQEYAKAHQDKLQQKFLMSDRVMATSTTLEIKLLKGYSKEEFRIDDLHDIKKWWQVYDRTEGDLIDAAFWEYNKESGSVVIKDTKKWHEYTVNFLVYQLWDSVSFYNAITNNWDCEPIMPLDPRHPEVRAHLIQYLDQWLEEHPNTAVVRVTSVAYDFAVMYNEKNAKRYLDWTGYLDCMSVLALEEFEEEYGYALTGEDIIAAGTYNDSNRVPSEKYLDWMEFVQKFVIDFGKECVEHIHKANRKAFMFFCDHWIGTEPYGPHYEDMGFDGIINPCIDGVQARRIAEVPAGKVSEARLYPYFFPTNLKGEPSFAPGGDPSGECRSHWMKIRRAMMRKAADRISWGGYLDLATSYPDFIEYVTQLTNEFKDIHRYTQGTSPAKAPIKVAVLNAWGKIRTWISDEFVNGGVMEILSGLPVDVEFISFEDVKKYGISKDIHVIINTGNAYTAWSGGEYWADEQVLTTIKEWIYNGGGFIGIGEPTAYQYQERFFQLSDVLGVQREIGLSRSIRRPQICKQNTHFILEDVRDKVDLGYVADYVYSTGDETKVLAYKGNEVLISVKAFGQGRTSYMAGCSFSMENARLLERTIYWITKQEEQIRKWHTSNVQTVCAAYPETGYIGLINNDAQKQETVLYDGEGRAKKVELGPYEWKWIEINNSL
jgi:1,3-beta-galactosyl-N-acetylhexosamine phosphorylase